MPWAFARIFIDLNKIELLCLFLLVTECNKYDIALIKQLATNFQNNSISEILFYYGQSRENFESL